MEINKENAKEILESMIPACMNARVDNVRVEDNELKANIWIKVPPMIHIDFTVNKDGTIDFNTPEENPMPSLQETDKAGN